jgi:putative endonuclease
LSFSDKEIGKRGEELAVKILTEKGWEIIDRNYQYGNWGEMDIIAKDKDGILVFIEVKTRTNLEYGMPEDSITKKKIKQLKKIAECYLYEKEIKDTNCRIDVVSVLALDWKKPVVEHYENVT